MLERVVRNRVLRRRLPRDLGGGRLYVSPDAALKYLMPRLGEAEAELLGQARSLVRRGMSVWDVGANIGVFAFSAAWLAGGGGRVLAVEADPWLACLLQRSAAAASPEHGAPVGILCAAVGDRAGVGSFNIAARGRASNALEGYGRSQTGGVRYQTMVGMVTLDDLLDASFRPDLVKIDIEGAEFLALSAAPRLMAARPSFLVEVGGEASAGLTELFHAQGYRPFDAARPLQVLPAIDHCTWNTLAVPAEHRFSVT